MEKVVKEEEKVALIFYDKTSIEHLGSQFLGGLLKDHGWRIVYHPVLNRDYSKLETLVGEQDPSLILGSIYTGNHKETFGALDQLRANHPDKKTVLGGPHGTYFPEEAVKHVDHVVMSEGFEPLRRIITEMERPKIMRRIRDAITKFVPNYLTPKTDDQKASERKMLEAKGEKKSKYGVFMDDIQDKVSNAFRNIFGYATPKGIQQLAKTEKFPLPDRVGLYEQHPEYGRSSIKSSTGTTGCPYKCTYCYNSSTPADLAWDEEQAKMFAAVMGSKGNKASRLFPSHLRSIDDLVKEGREIREMWPETEMIYFQDDIFGQNLEWLREFKAKWPKEVGLRFHGQMRWEMTDNMERLELVREAGGHGLTLAIEAANQIIREELLDRRTCTDELTHKGMERVINLGFKVRTEQIGALPYGGTSRETDINLNADFGLLDYNVDLFDKFGGPTQGWMSLFAPYLRVKLGNYSVFNGFYKGDNNDVSETFFARPVLRFLKEWIGPSLHERQNDPGIWLPHDELERYRDQVSELRNHFQFFVRVPDGNKLAREYILGPGEYNYERIGKYVETHLGKYESQSDSKALRAHKMSGQMKDMRVWVENNRGALGSFAKDLDNLAPYFACLPKGELAMTRVIDYARKAGEYNISADTLSKAVRHHLYDEVLYEVSSPYNNMHAEKPTRIIIPERYPAKL